MININILDIKDKYIWEKIVTLKDWEGTGSQLNV